jgi:hypothetical protein
MYQQSGNRQVGKAPYAALFWGASPLRSLKKLLTMGFSKVI